MNPRTDEQLLLDYGRTGNRAALSELVERRYPDAHRVATHLLRDPERAQDVAQEAFARLMVASKRYKARGSFKGYLYRIVVNTVRNQENARRRREQHEAAASQQSATTSRETFDSTLDTEIVARHVEALPADVRHPLVLHYFEGLTHAEVALALDLREGTASSRMRRGLELLKRKLGEAGFKAIAKLAIEEALREVAVGTSATATPLPTLATLEARAGVLRQAATASTITKVSVAGILVAALTTVAFVLPGAGDASLGKTDDAPTVTAPAVSPATIDEPSDENARTEESAPTATPVDDQADAPSAESSPFDDLVPRARSTGHVLVMVVDAESGSPLNDASVELERVFSGFTMPTANGRTNEAGEARLGPADTRGRYLVRVSVDGYAPITRKDIAVSEDRDTTVRIELTTGAVLFGRVTDENGVPLEHAAVGIYLGPPKATLIQPLEWIESDCSTRSAVALGYEKPTEDDVVDEAEEAESPRNSAITLTDANGRFRLEQLSPGRRPLVIVHVDYANANRVVTLEEGVASELEVALEPGGELRGFACRADGSYAIEATVVVSGTRTSTSREATVDATGRYRVRGLASDRYSVMLIDMAEVEEEEDDDDWAPKFVRVEAPEIVEFDFGPKPTGVAVAGLLLRADSPVEGETVTLTSVSADGSSSASTDSDSDGRFRFPPTTPGDYRLEVHSLLSSSPTWSETITLRPGQVEHRCEIRLASGVIRGRTRASATDTDEFGLVLVVATEVETGRRSTTLSGVGDEFELTELPPGTYRLQTLIDRVCAPSSDPITLKEGGSVDDLELRCPSGPSVTVRVVDHNGTPEPNVAVLVMPTGERPLLPSLQVGGTRTNDRGELTVDRVASGRYDFFVYSPGRPIGTRYGISVDKIRDEPVEVQLPRSATLKVEVIDPEGTPVSGVNIDLLDARGRPLPSVLHDVLGAPRPPTDAAGTLRIEQLAAGEVRVVASQAKASARATATLAPDESTTLRVVLRHD